jgi:hypothetical protein
MAEGEPDGSVRRSEGEIHTLIDEACTYSC